MKKKFISICKLIGIISLLFTTAVTANQKQFAPEKRERYPAAFSNSYFGLGAGYTNTPYSNRHLINGFSATSFTNPSFGLNVFIGHFFNKYIAGQISLMRPIKWAYANGVDNQAGKHSIWVSLFGITLRPTLPITNQISLYGQAGLGIVSRHGFNIGNINAIPSEDLFTFLTGAGLTYAINPNWHLNFGLEYSAARNSEHQPQILYTSAGFYYLMTQKKLPDYYNDHYIFHKNLIQIGGFSTSFWHPKINKYFTVGYLPIFWTGDLKTRDGASVMYMRNIYHTHKRFSFDVGASISTYHSNVNRTSFQAFSVFPMFRFWLVRSNNLDFYFSYELAGPSYLTRSKMDGIDLGGRFTFQDLMGVGLFLGKHKNMNIDFRIGHYSNGNLLPTNPGIEVPLMISAGYAF